MKLKLLLILLFLSPFIIISFFNQPSLDDYWSANVIRDNGRLQAVQHLYHTVSGRYFSNFIMSICNSLPNGHTWVFKIAPVITIILLCAVFYFFYTSIFISINKWHLLLASLISVAVHIVNMRSLYEGLYWMSAVVVYQLAIILFLTGIAAMISYTREPSFLKGFIVLFCCISLPGTSELIAPVYLILITLIVYLRFSKKRLIFFSSCIILTLAGVLLTLFSPGNHLRTQNDSAHYSQNFLFALQLSFESVVYYLFIGMINPVNVLLLAILLPFLLKISALVNNVVNSLKPLSKIFLFAIASVLFCMIIYFPLYYFEADIPFPRITTMVFLIGFLLSIVFLCLLLNRPSVKRFVSTLVKRKNYQTICWSLFFVAVFFSKNFKDVSHDLLNGSAYNFNKEYLTRFKELRSCKTDTCYVAPFKYWPSSIMSTPQENKSSLAFLHQEEYFQRTILFKNK